MTTGSENSSTPGRIIASMIAGAALIRGVPLLFARSPQTPLRVLCIVAFDAMTRLRTSRWLTSKKRRQMAMFLDFAACMNAKFDGKPIRRSVLDRAQQELEAAGLGRFLNDYAKTLEKLERSRPAPGGDDQRFDDIRRYREAVVRHALSSVAAIAFEQFDTAKGIEFVRDDRDLQDAFRIVMLCQMTDDLLDYAADLQSERPSFLTAAQSRSRAIVLSGQALAWYMTDPNAGRLKSTGPLQAGLVPMTQVVRLLLLLAGWRDRLATAWLVPSRNY